MTRRQWYDPTIRTEYEYRPVGLSTSTKSSQNKPMHRRTRSARLLVVTLLLVLGDRCRLVDWLANHLVVVVAGAVEACESRTFSAPIRWYNSGCFALRAKLCW